VIAKTKPRKPAKADKPRGASKPETLPASLKDIGHAVRENFERKAAALYERWKKGDVDLQSAEVELLKKVPTETLSRHELERAMALFDIHARQTKAKPSTAIATQVCICNPKVRADQIAINPYCRAPHASTAIVVRPAAVVTVEATGSERKFAAAYEKAWNEFGRCFLTLGTVVLEARDAGISVERLTAITGLNASRTAAYQAARATELWRVFQPFAQPAKVVLDCESVYRDFPADLKASPSEARKIVKLIEREIEPDKRGNHRPTREQLRPIIAKTVGLRGLGPEKVKPQRRPEHLQELSAEVPSRTSTAETPSGALDPGMFARGPQPIAAGRASIFTEHLFPHCDSIEQACCVLRSWILALTRQFQAEALPDLDEELYRQCQVLRDIYRPAIQQAATEAAKKTARRAR
jgi:hypothetical protein